MTRKQIENLMVIGAGTMGAGIAQVAVTAGCRVQLYDHVAEAVPAAIERIEQSLKRAASKGYISPETPEAALSLLEPASKLSDAAKADAVLEAVKEDLAVKQALLVELEEHIDDATPLWTNTSMLNITRLASVLQHPHRLVGTHFFNPAPRMKLVEIVPGRETAQDISDQAEQTMRDWGKTPVLAPDTPGFIVNRIFDAIKRESLALLNEGTPPQRIDEAVRLGLNFPMGPFEVMDLVGLDTTYDCLRNQAQAMGRPAAFGSQLPELIEQGNLGRKTGNGFYSYD